MTEIRLLYFPGCPHVESARQALAEALGGFEEPPPIIEVDATAPNTPPELRSWGSPTILIDGVDVVEGVASGSSCRLYPNSDRRGAPPLSAIQEALRRARENPRP
jgi:mercuric ion transport protein